MKISYKNIYRLRTSSIWGYPPRRFFRYLDMLYKKNLPKTLCILGCSDGRYVIPAAKRCFRVCAIDTDRTAVYGGYILINNRKIKIKGLIGRLKEEKEVGKYVRIVNEDFVKYSTSDTFSGVFTSGSIQYVENNQYSLRTIIDKIQSLVSVEGALLLEYIHTPDVIKDNTRYLTASQIKSFFRNPEWTVTSNKVKEYVEPANPRNPSIHKIKWGRLYATKNKPIYG